MATAILNASIDSDQCGRVMALYSGIGLQRSLYQPVQELSMPHIRIFPLAVALAFASLLPACTTVPAAPMGGGMGMGGGGMGMGSAGQMAKMDDHMKTMRAMHEKMMGATTPEERSKLMAEHMKIMQDGMGMMGGMDGMGGMGDSKGMPDNMGDQHKMMAKHMEMMHSMMQMMMDRLPPAPAKP
jgi:hypothetical protein